MPCKSFLKSVCGFADKEISLSSSQCRAVDPPKCGAEPLAARLDTISPRQIFLAAKAPSLKNHSTIAPPSPRFVNGGTGFSAFLIFHRKDFRWPEKATDLAPRSGPLANFVFANAALDTQAGIQRDISVCAFGCSGGLRPPSSIGDRRYNLCRAV